MGIPRFYEQVEYFVGPVSGFDIEKTGHLKYIIRSKLPERGETQLSTENT